MHASAAAAASLRAVPEVRHGFPHTAMNKTTVTGIPRITCFASGSTYPLASQNTRKEADGPASRAAASRTGRHPAASCGLHPCARPLKPHAETDTSILSVIHGRNRSDDKNCLKSLVWGVNRQVSGRVFLLDERQQRAQEWERRRDLPQRGGNQPMDSILCASAPSRTTLMSQHD